MRATDPPPPPHPRPRTERRGDAVLTTVSGRILVSDVDAWWRDYRRLRGARVWLFDATLATGYEIPAVDRAAETFLQARDLHGLESVVAAIRSRMVRMGARLVSMATRLDIRVVGTMEEAEAIVQKEKP